MSYPDHISFARMDAALEGDADRRAYERDKFDEARQTLAAAWAALVAARNAWAGVYELSHEFEAGMSYDPADFAGYIAWEMDTVRDVAKAYGVVLEVTP